MKMFQRCAVFASLAFLLTCFDKTLALDTACADWLAFKDEKCYKILDDTFRTYAEAEQTCAGLDNNSQSSLPIIRTAEEQDFLANYLFKSAKKVENFWIGAKFSNTSKHYHWVDESEVGSFTNWDTNGEKNRLNYCVQMEADEASVGKWIDEPCEKKNLVVCQRMQTWSLARLQRAFLDARKESRDSQADSRLHIKKNLEQNQKTLQDAKKELADSLADSANHIKDLEKNQQTLQAEKKELADSLAVARNQITKLEHNPVPVDFIYVQMAGQSRPEAMWPALTWTDVTSVYAGLFFRAEGGGSGAFGYIQQENSPRLSEVSFERDYAYERVWPQPGEWTQKLRTGGNNDGDGIAFLVSGGEVRPRNEAIRIWKRTG